MIEIITTMSVIVGTRIHGNLDKYTPQFYDVRYWCYQALHYADYVVIGTDKKNFAKIRRSVKDLGEKVHPILIMPWKGFVNPLNAIIYEANLLGGNNILFQSIEVYISFKDFEILDSHLKSDTLVVGGKMSSIHGGKPGTKVICGMTSPWNTLDLWNLQKLNVTGFLKVSSGIIKDVPGGMEEVPTISILQQLYSNECQAKLVSIPDLSWKTNTWNDPEREKYHQEKMKTKYLRSEAQLKYSKIKPGNVTVL